MFIKDSEDSINYARKRGSKDKKPRARSIGQKLGGGAYKASAAVIGVADKTRGAIGKGLYKASSLAIRGGGAVLDKTQKTRKQLSKGFGEGFNEEMKKKND